MSDDKKAVESEHPSEPDAGQTPEEPSKDSTGLSREELMRKAYARVARKLDDPQGNGKVIDELVKLVKLEKDLGEEHDPESKVSAQWISGEDESSKEE